ncbi:MAG: tryptophan-rich sensory protein [Clostridia bacterium]|nr:tryptophan-rich sensory protein [Clostridia bacterium]
MKIQWKKLLICLAIPLAVGGLSAWVTMGAMEDFAALNQPPLSPPGWLFPVVWTILFLLMGLASYLVLTSGAHRTEIRSALTVYGVQLAVNFFWSVLFFNLGAYLLAFIWLVFLWALIFVTMRRFAAIRPLAGKLLIPYLLWVTFAGYLNLGIYVLN